MLIKVVANQEPYSVCVLDAETGQEITSHCVEFNAQITPQGIKATVTMLVDELVISTHTAVLAKGV